MKLARIGETGKEKPVVIDEDGNYRDLSSIIKDFNPNTLNFNTIEEIKKIIIKDLPTLDKNLRVGPCVSNPSKFIGIGLNYRDHAIEQNMPIPKEPIIFSKFTSSLSGPNCVSGSKPFPIFNFFVFSINKFINSSFFVS